MIFLILVRGLRQWQNINNQYCTVNNRSNPPTQKFWMQFTGTPDNMRSAQIIMRSAQMMRRSPEEHRGTAMTVADCAIALSQLRWCFPHFWCLIYDSWRIISIFIMMKHHMLHHNMVQHPRILCRIICVTVLSLLSPYWIGSGLYRLYRTIETIPCGRDRSSKEPGRCEFQEILCDCDQHGQTILCSNTWQRNR